MINVLPGIWAALIYLGESVAIWDAKDFPSRNLIGGRVPVVYIGVGCVWEIIMEGGLTVSA